MPAEHAVVRLLFVAHSGQISGAEKVMLSLVDEALDAGLAVLVACPDGPLSEQLPPGCGHLQIPSLGLAGESGFARMTGMAQTMWSWWTAGRILAEPARRAGTRTVINSTIALPAVRLARPDGGATWLVHDTTTSTKQRIITRIGRSAIRFAVAMSDAAAAPPRAAGIRVKLARYGVALPTVTATGQLHSPPVIGMLALMTAWKGHSVLLDAAAAIPEVRVELAGGTFPGDEAYEAALRARALQPDLDGRVRFLGHIPTAVALDSWDVVVSASVLPEAGPLSVLEAMAAGVAVVGTDHGGTREFLSDGRGTLVPPGDPHALAVAIQKILGDGEARRATVDSARQYVIASHNIVDTMPLLFTTLTA